MELLSLTAERYDAGRTVVDVRLNAGGMTTEAAINAVLAMINGTSAAPAVSREPSPTPSAPEAGAQPATRTRTRQPRTNPDAAPSVVAEAIVEGAAEPSSRRRRPVEAVEAGPKVYSDVDLSKAASQAAADLANLGEDGPGIILTILKEDYSTNTTNDVPQEKRQEFLDALQIEINLVKAEKAAA